MLINAEFDFEKLKSNYLNKANINFLPNSPFLGPRSGLFPTKGPFALYFFVQQNNLWRYVPTPSYYYHMLDNVNAY